MRHCPRPLNACALAAVGRLPPSPQRRERRPFRCGLKVQTCMAPCSLRFQVIIRSTYLETHLCQSAAASITAKAELAPGSDNPAAAVEIPRPSAAKSKCRGRHLRVDCEEDSACKGLACSLTCNRKTGVQKSTSKQESRISSKAFCQAPQKTVFNLSLLYLLPLSPTQGNQESEVERHEQHVCCCQVTHQ